MFKIGQKVVCIDNSGVPELKLNEIYVIDEMYACSSCGVTGLIFYSISKKFTSDIAICRFCFSNISPPTHYSFKSERFRPLEYNNCHDELLKNIAIEKLDGKEIKIKEKISN